MKRLVVLFGALHVAGCTYGFRTDCDGDAGESRVGPFCYRAESGGGGAGGGGAEGGGGVGGGGAGGTGGGVVEPDAGGPCDVEPLRDACACRPGQRCLADGGCGVGDRLALELVRVPEPVLLTPALVCGRVTLSDGGSVPADVALPAEVTVSAPGLDVDATPARVGRAGRFTFSLRASPGQWVDRRLEVSATGAEGLIALAQPRKVSVLAPPRLDVNPSTTRGPQWAVGGFAASAPRVDDLEVTVRARWEDGGPGATPPSPPALRLDGGLLALPCTCEVGWQCACAALPVPDLQEAEFTRTFDAVVRYDDGGAEAARTTFPVTRYRWVVQAGGAVVAAPAIDFEGNVYFGTRTSPGAGALVSVGPLGDVRWSIPLGEVQSVALSTLSDGGLVGYSTAMTDAGATIVAFSSTGTVVRRRDFPGLATARDLALLNEDTSYTPMVHLFDGGGSLLQWNPEAPERPLFEVVGDDEAPPVPMAPGMRANLSTTSSGAGREARYVGRSGGRNVVFSIQSDAGVLSRRPDSVTALPNGLTIAVAIGPLTRLWGSGAGPVVSSPGGVGTLVSDCPFVLDRQSFPRGCTEVPGERFEVAPVASRRFTPPLSITDAYLMQVSSSRTLVLARPDGGIAALERLPLDGGRPFAPLALGCHRPEPGRGANTALSLLYVTTDDGQVLSIVTPSAGLNTDTAWPKHQGGLVNQGTVEGEAVLRADCP